ncbi:MAG: hypothetical protein JSU08_17625 [Acidobacteria bacterium]|nr:hypothetical protein [Acidobacteriota bacterium]
MLFRSVPIADAVFRDDRLPAGLAAHPRDEVVIGWEDRRAQRARLKTEAGVEFGTSLPQGTVLREGDCLALDRPALVIIVREKAEPVLVMAPPSAGDAARWAYYIGNTHQPLMVLGDLLLCADVAGMDEVLRYHGIPFTRELRPFTPVSQGPSHHR